MPIVSAREPLRKGRLCLVNQTPPEECRAEDKGKIAMARGSRMICIGCLSARRNGSHPVLVLQGGMQRGLRDAF